MEDPRIAEQSASRESREAESSSDFSKTAGKSGIHATLPGEARPDEGERICSQPERNRIASLYAPPSSLSRSLCVSLTRDSEPVIDIRVYRTFLAATRSRSFARFSSLPSSLRPVTFPSLFPQSCSTMESPFRGNSRGPFEPVHRSPPPLSLSLSLFFSQPLGRFCPSGEVYRHRDCDLSTSAIERTVFPRQSVIVRVLALSSRGRSSSASLFALSRLRLDVPDCVHVQRNPDDSLIRGRTVEACVQKFYGSSIYVCVCGIEERSSPREGRKLAIGNKGTYRRESCA